MPPIRHVTGELRDCRFDKGSGEVSFNKAALTQVSFQGIRFRYFAATESVFVGCDFSKIKSSPYVSHLSVTPQCIYRDCNFDQADLRNFQPSDARFERCSFAGARLDGWRATSTEFIDCVFSGRIKEARFWGRPFDDHVKRPLNEFRGNDFRAAELIDTSFVMGIDIGAQMWPESDRYIRLDRMSERLRLVRAEVVHWTDLKDRKEALTILEILGEDVATGQEELFANCSDLAVGAPEVCERVWNLLAGAVPAD